MNQKAIDLIVELSEGNQAAFQLLLALYQRFEFTYLNKLKDQGIFGFDIWLLFKDECGQDFSIFIAVLDAKTAHAQLIGNRASRHYEDPKGN